MTVDELAVRLALTDNAIRLHLAALERDRVVRALGPRREGGVGKPAMLYEIAPDAEPAFSRAYAPVLAALLASLRERLSGPTLRAVLRDTGKRLAPPRPAAHASAAERARAASRLLNSLGGVTSVVRNEEDWEIRGCGCPLSLAVDAHPEICLTVRTLLRDAVGAEVTEHCERTGRPRCRFRIVA